MDMIRTYNLATAGVLTAQAAPLMFSPSMVVWMLSPETRSATPLESSISRTLSFSLLLIAFLQLLLTGEVHRFLNQDDDEPSEQVQSKYAIPTLLATTIYHSILSIHLYISGIRFLSTAHGILAFAGIMVQMFRNEGKISKRTGADKRTSGFLFKNASADAKHDRKRR